MGAYGREVIFKYYSVTKMAGDCVCAYNAAWKESHEKQYNVVMSGYYGFNNTGDEAIMLSMHKNIQGWRELPYYRAFQQAEGNKGEIRD